jgi:hypothetical protein
VATSPPTAEDKKALMAYMLSGHQAINGQLRGEPQKYAKTSKETVDARIAALDRMARGGKLVREQTLFRGTDLQYLGDVKVGTVYRDKGFMSTSRSEKVTESFRGNAVIRIRATKGTRVIDVGHHTGVHDEQEMILSRNAGLRVTKVTKSGVMTIIDVTVTK